MAHGRREGLLRGIVIFGGRVLALSGSSSYDTKCCATRGSDPWQAQILELRLPLLMKLPPSGTFLGEHFSISVSRLPRFTLLGLWLSVSSYGGTLNSLITGLLAGSTF